jgi:hypothetical protein
MNHLMARLMARRIAIVFIGAVICTGAKAHLPSYEGESVRHDNHFIKEGYAWPVRGACDIKASGPTDINAGSANFYLGNGNIPPNFFCAFTSQDDWSFEFPLDIIEATRTPNPDPVSIGLAQEEGYIPCSPDNPNPFQCPRQIANPTKPGTVIKLPGQCVDLGETNDGNVIEPDGKYHCALQPGAPRPTTSSVLFSTLSGPNDVDWAIYRYDPVYSETPIVGAPQVPACRETIDSFATFAYAGPLGLRDARSGELLFMPLQSVQGLPKEIVEKLPKGYGIRVKKPSYYQPSVQQPRIGYASGFAQNAWLLAQDSVVRCIDDFEACLADKTGELSKHYNYNDLFFIRETTPVNLYLMWWADNNYYAQPQHKYFEKYNRRTLTDVQLTTGVVDQFVVGDFINTGISGPFVANGRYIHGRCSDPRPTRRVEIILETNQ